MTHIERFRTYIKDGAFYKFPGCYDAIGAKLIENAGYDGLYITGSGVSLSLLGHPDINTVSYGELYQRIYQIRSSVDIPMIVDIDTGYGGPLNLIRLIKDFEAIDIAAVQIEDQIAPKRCGHELGRKVVPDDEMKARIQTILDTRKKGISIIARTDAYTAYGIDECIRRANLYLEAGADIIFVESPETIEDIKRIGREVRGATLFNNVEGGRSPFVSEADLTAWGFKCSIYPNMITRVVCCRAKELLETLRDTGTTEAMWSEMMSHKDLWKLFGSQDFYDLEQKYSHFRD